MVKNQEDQDMEKIKELATKAKLGQANFDDGIGYYVATEETLEKFAILIIEECFRVVENKNKFLGGSKGSLEKEIKKHFGIENERT